MSNHIDQQYQNAPRYAIPQLSFPHKSFCTLFNALGNGMVEKEPGKDPEYVADANEIAKLIDLGDLLKFEAGNVGSGIVLKKARHSDVAWIDDNPNAPALQLRQWAIQRMQHIVATINRDIFQLDLDSFNPLQYTTYNLNQHYNWHVDVHEGMAGESHRKLSVVVMLSKPEDYEGGELELNIGGSPDEGDTLLLKPPAGTAIAFYSHIPHRVRPVTSGKRISLVQWALGPKLR